MHVEMSGPVPAQATITPFAQSPRPNAALSGLYQASDAVTPRILKLIVVAIFLPEQLSFYFLGMRLTVARLIFIALTPVLLIKLGQKLATARYRFVLSDFFVPLAGCWMLIGPANVVGVREALSHGGPIALEFCVGYMVTRVLLSEYGQSMAFANLLCCMIAIIALLGPLDPLSGHFVTRELAGALTGYRVSWADNLFRFGLLRATGTLEHSILFGIACAIGFLIAAAVPIRARKFTIVASSVGAISALSSAPIQGIFMGLALLIYNRILAGVRLRWFGLVGLTAAAIVLVFTISDAPFGFIFRHLIADPESGYFRLYTWQVGGDALAQSPWFGLGFEFPKDYEIPASIDSVWLKSALMFGIPGSVLIALSIIGAASLPTSGPRARLTSAESKLGTILGILIFLILFWGATVHFWGTDWILVAVLTGLRAHLGELSRVGVATAEEGLFL
jgi:hypothetical protein